VFSVKFSVKSNQWSNGQYLDGFSFSAFNWGLYILARVASQNGEIKTSN
jgi:hypothetical protein